MPTSHDLAEPPAPLLEAARGWLLPVREALGADFVAAYVTGSVLTQGFDDSRSRVNLLVIARELAPAALERLAAAIPAPGKKPRFEPLFMAREQIAASLDVFPIEWLDLAERHLLLAGEDALAGLDVPRTWLRHQCEHELRGKHIRLRQEFLAAAGNPERLREVLARLASGFHTLFRTLLRLSGEVAPAGTEGVIERIAARFGLDAGALLGAHAMRHAANRPKGPEVRGIYLRFLVEIERLTGAIDTLRIP